MVGDGTKYVEVAQGLQGLVGGGLAWDVPLRDRT